MEETFCAAFLNGEEEEGEEGAVDRRGLFMWREEEEIAPSQWGRVATVPPFSPLPLPRLSRTLPRVDKSMENNNICADAVCA